jgi:NADH-quinone oxidoreductase subunit L
VAAATALLTAFYMFRLLWRTFFGPSRMSAEVEHHVHESPLSMTGVLAVLAVLSAIGGFLSIPHFLDARLPLPEVAPELEHVETPLMIASIAIAFIGLAAAAFVYGGGGRRGERLRERFPRLHRVLSGKYFVDELYDWLIGRPLLWISDRVFLKLGDRALIDGSLHGLAALSRRSAAGLSRVQTGNLQLYALLVFAGLVAALVWMTGHG